MNCWRWFALVALPLLAFAAAACGGGGDDDDEANPLSSNEDSSDDERTDSSGSSGKLKVDGKDYTLDMETCELGVTGGNLTVLAAKMEGEDGSDFSASGVGEAVAIGVRFSDQAYMAVGQDLDINGKSVKWNGDLIDPSNPGKSVKGEFSMTC